MNLLDLAKQVVEFRNALLAETDDKDFINAMCGHYMTTYISILLAANMQQQ
jgi:hypothetical protein